MKCRGRCPHRPSGRGYEFAGMPRKSEGFSCGPMRASAPTKAVRFLVKFLFIEPYSDTERVRERTTTDQVRHDLAAGTAGPSGAGQKRLHISSARLGRPPCGQIPISRSDGAVFRGPRQEKNLPGSRREPGGLYKDSTMAAGKSKGGGKGKKW